MIISRKFFFKTLFVFNVFMINGALNHNFEELTVRYTSNYQGTHEVILILKNEDNSLVVTYGSYGAYLYMELTLKNGFKPKIKVAQLFIDGNDSNREYINCISCNFIPCREKWDKLLTQANDRDLYFNIIYVEDKTNIEQEYCFKVSAANLRKFVDSSANFFLIA